MWNLIKLDYYHLWVTEMTLKRFFSSLIFNPGFRSVVIYRIQQKLLYKKKYRFALMISNINQFLTGAEFCVGCEFGGGLIVRHPIGVVIGGGVKVGDMCILQHGVTLGEKYSQGLVSDYPVVGNYVSFGFGSGAIGGVKIGNNVTVGAGSLILNDVGDNLRVAGTPAKEI